MSILLSSFGAGFCKTTAKKMEVRRPSKLKTLMITRSHFFSWKNFGWACCRLERNVWFAELWWGDMLLVRTRTGRANTWRYMTTGTGCWRQSRVVRNGRLSTLTATSRHFLTNGFLGFYYWNASCQWPVGRHKGTTDAMRWARGCSLYIETDNLV